MKKITALLVFLVMIAAMTSFAEAQEPLKTATLILDVGSSVEMSRAIDSATNIEPPYTCVQMGPVVPYSYVYSRRVGKMERVNTVVRFTVQLSCPQEPVE